jgi:lipopolysaccharide transport system ATP-binding protein
MASAIRVENLGKRYRIDHSTLRSGFPTLRESLMHLPARLWHGWGNGKWGKSEDFWALRDVSFELERGGVLGIIGRNGAGKSTLLKILSRITRPTIGWVEFRGRISSLLEVGTGFHPELTGRENIFLNGAILGMSRKEIVHKFDEIVAFSEMEQFLDTPVKRYSSGMYVRLAFAVAAHLEPEILLVDEVLAVGDAGFQKKCLGKIGEVAKRGRTVLFVSHNMAAVQRLCDVCIWLDQGRLKLHGPTEQVVREYLDQEAPSVCSATLPQDPNKPMQLRKIAVFGQDSDRKGWVEFSEPVNLVLEYDINRALSSVHVACFVHDSQGICIFGTGDADTDPERLGLREPGRYQTRFQIPPRLLGEGKYQVTVTMGVPYVLIHDRHESLVQFEVLDKSSKRRELQHIRRPGILGLELPWSVEKLP